MRYDGKKINRLWIWNPALPLTGFTWPWPSGLMFLSIRSIVYQMKVKCQPYKGVGMIWWSMHMNRVSAQWKASSARAACHSWGPHLVAVRTSVLYLHLGASSKPWQWNVKQFLRAKNIFSWLVLTDQICLVFNTFQQSGLCSSPFS